MTLFQLFNFTLSAAFGIFSMNRNCFIFIFEVKIKYIHMGIPFGENQECVKPL